MVMRFKYFLPLILLFLFTQPLSASEGELFSLSLPASPAAGVLSGVDQGNELSFDVAFSTSFFSDNQQIEAVKLVYYQDKKASGLMQVIDRYTGQIIEAVSLDQAGLIFSDKYQKLYSDWVQQPKSNMGLMFKALALEPAEKVNLSSLALVVDYRDQDNKDPVIISQELRRNKSDDNYIIKLITDEPVRITLNYGKTSEYNLSMESEEFLLEHEFNIQNLTIGLSYHYSLTLTDTAGNKTFTKDAIFLTGADLLQKQGSVVKSSGNVFPPTALSVESASINGKKAVLLNFTAPTQGNVDSYILYRQVAGELEMSELAQIPNGASSYLDTDVIPGKTYTYMIRSLQNSEVSEDSMTVTYSIPATSDGGSILGIQTSRSNILIALFTLAAVLIFGLYLLMRSGKRIFNFLFPPKKEKLKNVLRDPENYS
jgi:hypothetical protein